MFAIVGILVVFGAIVGGYLMEHGKLLVLMQPAELVIIFGAAVGTVLIANPMPVVIKMAKMIVAVFGSNKFSKPFYLENLKMLNEIVSYARKSGMAKLESYVEDPSKSALGGAPEEIGHKVAAALVGTFLGILLCYGLFGPLAGSMAKINDAESEYYNCLRVGVINFIKGSPPIIATEFARRSIPSGCR